MGLSREDGGEGYLLLLRVLDTLSWRVFSITVPDLRAYLFRRFLFRFATIRDNLLFLEKEGGFRELIL